MVSLIIRTLIFFALVFAIGYAGMNYFFGPVSSNNSENARIIIPQNNNEFELRNLLAEAGVIRFAWVFEFTAGDLKPAPGGYIIPKNLYTWELREILNNSPDLVWLTISSCQRKEQIGEKIAAKIDWGGSELDDWNNLYAKDNSEYYEGVYYPDTYLIPRNATPTEIAQKFIDRFNDVFTPLSDDYLAKNIKWTTGLKIASLIQRETDVPEQMPIISGIIWNRLNINMPLQIDATMQYTRGKDDNGNWWGSIDLAERQKDSPYNSYFYRGLPPTPICSPGINAIKAALNPAETECLFYLHAPGKIMHCAKNYEQHLENIEKYLR